MSDREGFAFRVRGTAVPQGSKRMMNNRHTGKPIMLESGKGHRDWRQTVAAVARSTMVANQFKGFDGPVGLVVSFQFSRPRAHYRPANSRREYPELRDDAPPFYRTGGPDLDKLVRAICDSLQDSGMIKNDNQIVLLQASKGYTERDPCVLITLRAINN